MSGMQIVLDHEVLGYPDWREVAVKIDEGHRDCEPSSCCYRMVADEIRSQYDKPQEPTGLGAVVEATAYTDAIRIFVRTAGDLWVDAKGICHDWAELDVTKVLSEGVIA